MAKKKAPQRLAGAEESCISPEQEAIIQWFRTVKFRKNLLGGVDEAAMWKKLEELYALYEAAIRAERTRYNVLLAEQKGLPLNAEPDSFAKGSPTRATTTTAASGGNREELLGQRPAGHECNTLHEVDAGSRNPDAVTAKPMTERFDPGEPATPKEAHSDAPAGQ
ncbi:MAG TPA: hypothetical protein OIM47_01465 [Faecalibacterium prausnitzii]|nr:hypothetical protein [Faecalibacterium prausnitzii]